jgi:hypothetical protein
MPADFLLNWVTENINNGDPYHKGRREAQRLADRLVAAAAARGLSKTDLEAAAEEPLPRFLFTAMEDAFVLQARLERDRS